MALDFCNNICRSSPKLVIFIPKPKKFGGLLTAPDTVWMAISARSRLSQPYFRSTGVNYVKRGGAGKISDI